MIVMIIMVFGKTSIIYEQVPQGDPDGKSIDEDPLKTTFDQQASIDQKTTQILPQTKMAISVRQMAAMIFTYFIGVNLLMTLSFT